MYYHCRPLKYVSYGKITPPPSEAIDDDFIHCYNWLGQYCGYSPQIWLSRSHSGITGYKNQTKKNHYVMFGFDIIKGFPLDYDVWEFFIHLIFGSIRSTNSHEELNQSIYKKIQEYVEECEKDGDNEMDKYKGLSFEEILNNLLFQEKDQVVVPSLNLKSAKEIFCRDEKTKKKLRKMGFIEDRIKIMPNKVNFF